MAYPVTPETLDTDIGATQTTSFRDHADKHNEVNRLVNALMAKVGLDFDPNPLTLDWMIRNVIAGNLITLVDAILDDHWSSLPLTTATPVDWYTIQDNDKVYVIDSATPWEIGWVRVATVVAWNITRWLDHMRAVNEIIYCLNGTVYGDTFYFWGNVYIENLLTALTAYITNLTVNNLYFTGWGWQVIIPASWNEDNFDSTIPGWDTCVLTDNPISVNALFVFKKDAGTVWFQVTDYTFDVWTKTVTLVAPLILGEEIQVKYQVAEDPNVVPGWVAYYEEYVATGWEHDIVLNNTPAWANFIWISTESGLYGKQWLTRDRTYDAGTNTITMWYNLNAGDIVSIQYIGFAAVPANVVSDEAYWPTRDWVSDIAPSKNAIYNKIESMNSYPGGIFTSLPNTLQVLYYLLHDDVFNSTLRWWTPWYSDDINYSVIYGNSPYWNFWYVRLNNILGYPISAYGWTLGSNIIAWACIFDWYVFRLLTSVLLQKCSVTDSLGVPGNWSTVTFSWYALNANDRIIWFSDGKLYLLRGGTSDIRRFTWDSVNTFTYVDTIVTTLNTSWLGVNDNNYICYTAGSGTADGRPQDTTYVISVYDLNEVFLYSVSKQMIDRVYPDKMYVSQLQLEVWLHSIWWGWGSDRGIWLRWIYRIA